MISEQPKTKWNSSAGAGGGKDGGGGGGRPAVEAPDSLRSEARIRLLDAVCEGPIEGLATGDAQSIYFDDVPAVDSLGNSNFGDFQWVEKQGTLGQSHIPGFPLSSTVIPVSPPVKIIKGDAEQAISPVYGTFTVSDLEADAISLDIGTPSLWRQSKVTGDVFGEKIAFNIEMQVDNSGSWDKVQFNGKTRIVIDGKTKSKFIKTYRIDVPTATSNWQFRVVRLTDDGSDSLSLSNDLYLYSYSIIKDVKLRFPNTAIIGIDLFSDQFSKVPTRAYDLKLRQVLVPVNYDPVTRVYTGVWNGTFKLAWTDNPVWCWFDMLTNPRFGLGDVVDITMVDKWQLYSIAQYCDVLVPDGKGGTEPRFTCNLFIQRQDQAYKVMADMASIFRAMVYWGAGQVLVTQDSPKSVSGYFSPANVIEKDGGVTFTYQGTGAKARHNVVLVEWNDPASGYKKKVEYVEDTTSIATTNKINQTKVLAVGTTSRRQARFVGKWFLYSELNETELVTFGTGLDASYLRPGDIIEVADPNRQGSRLGGRIKSASGTTIILDKEITIDPITMGDTTLSCILPNGEAESRTVTSSGTNSTLILSSAFSKDPIANSIWVVAHTSIVPKKFRVLGIEEEAQGKLLISALEYNASKFDFIEQDDALEELPVVQGLSGRPKPPSNIVISEELYEFSKQQIATRVSLSWQPSESLSVVRYRIEYIKDGGNSVYAGESTASAYDLEQVQPGIYTFKIYAIDLIGQKSNPAIVENFSVLGLSAIPSDIENLKLYPFSDVGNLIWDKHSDLDVRVGGYFEIRFTSKTSGMSWGDGYRVGELIPGNATQAQVPLNSGTYMMKAVDSSGLESANFSSATTTIPSILGLNTVSTQTEHATFPGTHNNTQVVNGTLRLSSATLFDSRIDPADNWGDWDNYVGNFTPTGDYTFQNIVDLGSIFVSRISYRLEAVSFNVADLIDGRTALIDTWPDIDGASQQEGNATLEYASTNDDPAGSPTWSSWIPLIMPVDVEARAFKFRCTLNSPNSQENVLVSILEATVDMPDRIERGQNVSVGTGTPGVAITYNNAFYAVPAVGITVQGLTTGDYYQITNETVSGFEVSIFNSSATRISGAINWVANGYGRKT